MVARHHGRTQRLQTVILIQHRRRVPQLHSFIQSVLLCRVHLHFYYVPRLLRSVPMQATLPLTQVPQTFLLILVHLQAQRVLDCLSTNCYPFRAVVEFLIVAESDVVRTSQVVIFECAIVNHFFVNWINLLVNLSETALVELAIWPASSSVIRIDPELCISILTAQVAHPRLVCIVLFADGKCEVAQLFLLYLCLVIITVTK